MVLHFIVLPTVQQSTCIRYLPVEHRRSLCSCVLLNEVGHGSTWVLPCTTKLTEENILRTRLPKSIAQNTQACDVMIDKSWSIDNRRFKRELDKIPKILMSEVERKLLLCADLFREV